ncbi:unnamed protein product [Ixodes persulcatus]
MIQSSLHSTARRPSGKMDKFVLSETQKKKKKCLHLEGYKYYKRRQNANGMVAWRCCRYTSSGCAASILTEEDNVKSRSHDHNHAPDEATLVKDQLRVALKKAAATNPNTPVPRLFQEELLRTCSAVPDEVAAEVPTFSSLKDTMYRERRSAQPPLPLSASTLQLNDAHKKTKRRAVPWSSTTAVIPLLAYLLLPHEMECSDCRQPRLFLRTGRCLLYLTSMTNL